MCESIASMSQESRIEFFKESLIDNFWTNPEQSELSFKYKDYIFIASHPNRNFREIYSISYVTNENKVLYLCFFEREKKLSIKSVSNNYSESTCSAIDSAPGIKFDQPNNIAIKDEYGVVPPLGYREASLKGVARIDYNNDGMHENVASMLLESGAGRGCTKTFYSIIDDDLKSAVSNDSMLLISNCGYRSDFVSYNGKFYLRSESDYKTPPKKIILQNGTDLIDVCIYKDDAKLSLKEIMDIDQGNIKINPYSNTKSFINAYFKNIH